MGSISSRSELTGPSWITNSYYYSDTAHVHAVTGLSNGWEFGYDDVGNMTQRDDGAGNYLQEYNVENRLVSVAVTGTETLSVTQFVYDGNGTRVLTIWPDSTATAYVGEHYEVEGDLTRSYYWLGGQRIAMRVDDGETSEVYWLHTDHLGSTSLLSDEEGDLVEGSTTRFLPFGDYRVEPEAGLTDVGFTGHRHNDYIKLIDMRARWYSGQLGRFISPDTIVPNPADPQSLNRYTYVNNRPLVAVDPTGHYAAMMMDGKALPPPLPDSRYYYSEQYGWFDSSHLNTGRPGGIINDVKQAIGNGGGSISVRQKVAGGTWEYIGTYQVSGEATDEQAVGIALGIYMDWSTRFEEWQGDFPIFGKNTSFAIEDLPSHYIAFFAKANDLSHEEVFWMLGGVEGFGWEPPRISDGVGDWTDVKNFEFTPRVYQDGTWQNIPWPDEMTISPIGTESGLWEFWADECIGVVCP